MDEEAADTVLSSPEMILERLAVTLLFDPDAMNELSPLIKLVVPAPISELSPLIFESVALSMVALLALIPFPEPAPIRDEIPSIVLLDPAMIAEEADDDEIVLFDPAPIMAFSDKMTLVSPPRMTLLFDWIT